MIFAGEFEHRLDPQGRIAVPVRFRPAFSEGIVLSRAYDRCVLVSTAEEWARIAADIAARPTTRAAERRLARMTFAGAFPTEIDRQGRVLLPSSLRSYADLIDEVVIAGTGRFLEIWCKDAWSVERASIDAYGPKIAEDASISE